MQSSHTLLDRLKRVMKKAPRLILNLADVEYMDSSGIGVMVTALKISKEKNIPFALAKINERVGMVMDMSGLAVLFQIYADEETAIAELTA